MADPVLRPLVEVIAGNSADVAVAVLSLPDCFDRRVALLHRGLPSAWVEHYWPGYDLRRHPVELASKFLDFHRALQLYCRPWRTSEVGCALSHRSSLLAFLSTPSRFLLVLEDDVIPNSSALLTSLGQVVSPLLQVRPQALFCHLGPRPGHVAPTDLRPLRLRHSVVSPPLWIYQNHTRPIWRAHAYLISREAAQRCLELEPDGIYLLADDWHSRRQADALGLFMVTVPSLFIQDDNATSTQHESIPIAHIRPQSRSFLSRIASAIHYRLQLFSDRLLRRFLFRLR